MRALQDVDLDVEMKLAHALEDGLAGLRIDRDAERRILDRHRVQGDRHLFLVGLRLRLDLHLDDGLGEFHLLENDRLVGIAQRLAGAGILQALQRDDVAGKGFLDLFAVVGVHQIHAADALLLVARGVGERHALLELARVDAAERDRADVLEAHDLEGDHRQRICVDRTAQRLLAGLGIDALVGFAIRRATAGSRRRRRAAAARPCS